jgi:hypothetical protein
MKGKIKSFSVWKTSKIAAIVTFAFVALFSWFFLGLMVMARMNHQFHSVHPTDFRDIVVLCAAFPVVESIAMFLLVAVMARLYNVLSPRFGDIEIELETDSSTPHPSN